MNKVELFECIRKDYFNHRKSIRSIAKERHVHRRLVRQAIENATPPPRKPVGRQCTVLTVFIKRNHSACRWERPLLLHI